MSLMNVRVNLCPICSRDVQRLLPVVGGCRVVCDPDSGGCGAAAAKSPTEADAVANWNGEGWMLGAPQVLAPCPCGKLGQQGEYRGGDAHMTGEPHFVCCPDCNLWAFGVSEVAVARVWNSDRRGDTHLRRAVRALA